MPSNNRTILMATLLIASSLNLTIATAAPDSTGAQGQSLLSRVNFQLKHFATQGNTANTVSGLGFTYNIDETVNNPNKVNLSDNSYRKYKINFKAEGNVAFDSNINPDDFLKTGFDIVYNYEYATVVDQSGYGCDPTDLSKVEQCRQAARHSKTGDGLSLDAGLVTTLESNQKFDKKAMTYGGQATLSYRPAPGSVANQANPLDWPFRLLRLATNHKLGSDASPDAFPKMRIAYEQISPINDKDREAILGNKNNYDRMNVELALTSPIGMIQGKQVKFEWGWRYFKELRPNAVIIAANLDRFRYSAMSLKHDSGWRITYTSGRLPLDRQSDKVWELGYDFHFD